MSPKTATGTPSEMVDLGALAQAAECLRTLAHPHRLRMVEMLLDDRYTVGELARSCGIPSPVASGHLRLMQRCGLLAQQREGRRIYYRVCEPCLKDFLACVRKRFGERT
jgi:ArsR family transcriptional regulator, zinc-responsive transcriptional repressor